MVSIFHRINQRQEAQSGKKVPIDLAERWIDISNDIIQAVKVRPGVAGCATQNFVPTARAHCFNLPDF